MRRHSPEQSSIENIQTVDYVLFYYASVASVGKKNLSMHLANGAAVERLGCFNRIHVKRLALLACFNRIHNVFVLMTCC